MNFIGIDSSKNKYIIETSVLIGLSSLTLFSSVLSIFLPINSFALIGIVIFSLIISKSIPFGNIINVYTQTKVRISYVVLFLILILLISSQMISIADTGIHHAQTIQWIRKFGLVPGLANLQPQIGFNSAFFLAQAVFVIDIKDFMQGYDLLVYPLNGVLLLLLLSRLLLTSFDVHAEWVLRIFCISVFSLCLLLLPRWANSASPDMAIAIISIFLFYFLLQSTAQDYRIPIIIIVCVLTYKLSAAMLGLLLLYYLYISNSKQKFILFGLVTLCLFFLPYFYRNYILSGYLVFPLYQIDLFNPDWKYPLEAARFEYSVVKSWARISSINPYKMLEMPMVEWVPVWFKGKDLIEKFLLFSTIMLLPLFTKAIIRKNFKMVFISISILFNFLFWFWGAPDPRFAFGIFFVNIGLFLTSFSTLISIKLKGIVINFMLIVAFTSSIFYNRGQIIKSYKRPKTFLIPDSFMDKEYINSKTNFDLKISRMNLKLPCNNTDLPCSSRTSTGFDNIYLRDSLLSNGFKVVTK